MEIIKQTKTLGTLTIKEVDKNTAKDIIIKNHYSHKWNTPFGKYNFGIFRDNTLLGVAVYGYMMNPKAKIFTSKNPDGWMIELNRMWIDDTLGHNAETVLIGASLKLLKKLDSNILAVQSFADGRLGCGTIYKASNFKYYGFSESVFWENIKTGEIVHNASLTNSTCKSGYTRHNTEYLNGELKPFKVKTYRYIYPFDKFFVFKDKQKPYPIYDKGLTYINVKRDEQKIKENINRLQTS